MGLLPWLLALAAGIFTASFGPSVNFLVPLLTGLAAGLCFCLRQPRLYATIAFLFFFLAGYSLFQIAQKPPPDRSHICHWVDDNPARISGIVQNVAPRPGGKGRLDIEATTLVRGNEHIPLQGLLRLYHEAGTGETVIRPGDRVWFRARLRRPQVFGTPGEFNFPRYLETRDIYVTAYVSSIDEIAVMPASIMTFSSSFIKRMRLNISAMIRQCCPENSGLVSALLIGEKSALDSAQRGVLSRSGTSHLFSISGFHIGLIAFYSYHLLLLGWRRSQFLLLRFPPKRYLPLAVIPILFIYLELTGSALPTLRAFLMAVAGALLWVRCWRTAPLNLVWAVALLLLVVDPLFLFDISFQLSFAGVVGIMVLVPRWSSFCHEMPKIFRWFCLLFLTTAAATLATLPLTLLHFHILAPAGLLANLAAVPVIGLLAVPLGFLAIVLMPVWPSAGQVLLTLDASIIQALYSFAAKLVSLPFLSGWSVYLSPAEWIFVSLVILLLLWPGWSLRLIVGRVVLIGGGLLLVVPTYNEELTVTAISVGQGESILLSLGSDHHILIDGGGLYSDTFDVGERLVAPALGFLGVRHLSAVVLTHDHPDHHKGLAYIVEHFDVDQFWSPKSVSLGQLRLGELLVNKRVDVRHFDSGWTTVNVLNPFRLQVFQPPFCASNKNDSSLIIYAGVNQEGVLLTGDLEQKGVADVLSQPLPGRVSLLKLPHHGSSGSNSERLVDYLRPQAAFVSAGRNNHHGLPSGDVVDHLEERGIPLFRTDLQGSLRMRTTGMGWEIKTWKNHRFH